MCGIFGLVSNRIIENDKLLNSAKKFLGSRGPDGINFFRRDNIYLSHSRLAINDLTEKGSQPFKDKKEEIYSITNGEIYNDKELRIKENLILESSSDCAVIPDLFRKKGIEAFKEINGMFSSAIVDYKNKNIIICRDNEGIKPLYYLEDNNFLAFSSSNQHLANLFNTNTIDSLAISLFLVLKYIPAPMTGFRKIKKLLPGEIRIYSLEGNFIKSSRIKKREFKLIEHNPKSTRSLIINSVKEHLNSDVNIASLLSGGLDSSIVTYEAKKILGDIEAFTAFQEDPSEDADVIHSNILSKELGIKNNLIKIPSLNYEKISNPLKKISEPTADPAFITGYYLINQIKESNKVLLSGDGADEIFGGYGILKKHKERLNKTNITHGFSELIPTFNKYFLAKIIYKNKYTKKLLKNFDSSINERLLFLSIYSGLPISLIWLILPEKIINIIDLPVNNSPQVIQDYELNQFMPNYFLNKVDSMSMLNSVEVRNPFISGIIRKNAPMYVNNGYSNKKESLLECYKSILPNEIINRQKVGFTRNLDIFRDSNKWNKFCLGIPLESIEFLNLPLKEIIHFSKYKTKEAFEIRWRLFALFSWLSGNNLLHNIDFEL